MSRRSCSRRWPSAATSRGVDEGRSVLEESKAFAGEQALRLLCQRHMERDDVGPAEKLVERKPVAAAVMDDLHPERLRAPGDLGADPSQTDEPERRSGE